MPPPSFRQRSPARAADGIGLSLVVLVLVAIVPLLILGGGVAWLMIDQKQAALATELASTARALRVAVDRELVSQFGAMEILASDASLDHGDLPAFHERARRAVQAHGGWRNVALIEPRSHAILASAEPAPSVPATTQSPDDVDRVVRTRKPVVAGLFVTGRLSSGPRILLMSPVLRGDEVRFVLVVAMYPRAVSEVFTEQRLSPSWTGAVVDNHMLLAGRSRDAERFVGVRSTPSLADRIAAAESGMFTALNQEGATVYTVFSRSPITGWSVAIGVPAAEVDGPIRHLLLQLAAAGGALIAFALMLTGTVGTGIVRRRNAYEAAMRESEDQLRVAAVAFRSHEGMLITDAGGIIQRVNQAFEAATGYSAAEVVGARPALLSSGRHDPLFYRQMWQSIERDGYWQGEIWNRKKSGEIFPEWLSISTVRDQDDRITHYVGAFFDISERKAAEIQIRSLAFFDPLTNLPNRRLLMDRLGRAVAASARSRHFGAVMLLDLDHFKTLNDSQGHEVGDRLLTQVAGRLTASVREEDTVGRLGGDEFIVMLEDLGDDERLAAGQAEAVAEKLRNFLADAYTLPGSLPGNIYITSSIGLTLFRGHDEAIDVLLKHADIALYQAKDAGRNAIRFFNPAMQEVVDQRAAVEARLRQAIELGAFTLYFQPQVARHRGIVGAEALLRWQPPGEALLLPSSFIALAEETGLILPIGQWVLQTACAQIAAWAGDPRTAALVLAVNVSARELRQADFVERVRDAIAAHRVAPGRLKLELTEGMLLDDVEDTIAKMQALKALGVGFSLDDFGTGYSSLAYLRRLPLDQVKIDQSFVRDLPADAGAGAIVQTIIDMSRTMHLQVIAEGVETDEQRAFLEANGCHHYQGYLFGRPLPLAEFEMLLAVAAPG